MIEVTVSTINGKIKITVNIDENATIADLKALIVEKEPSFDINGISLFCKNR